MNQKRTLFWLTISAIGLVGANIALSFRPPTARSLQHRSLLESAFEPTKVTIERLGEPKTVIEKAMHWTMTEPYAASVEEENVLRLLDAFSFTKIDDAVSDQELVKLGRTRGDFGLDEPTLTVSFTDAMETIRVSFGSATASSNAVYAAVEGSDAVLVVPAEVYRSADLDSRALRDRNVFPFPPDFVSGFDLKTPDSPAQVFVRSGDGWKVGGKAASASLIRDFLTSVSDEKALDFVWPIGATNESSVASASLLSGYGLDADSALVLNLHCADGRDRRLLLGRDPDSKRSYALIHDGAAIVTLDSRLKTLALQGTTAFVDSRLFPLEEPAVSSFSLTKNGVTYVLARGTEDSWRFDSPIVAPAHAEAVREVLGRLLTLGPDDLDEDGLAVSVSTNLPTFRISAPAVLGKLRPEDLRTREILKIDPALVKRVVLSRQEKSGKQSVSLIYSRERRAWMIESAQSRAESEVDEALVKDLLSALSPLSAQTIVSMKVSPSDLTRYGLEKPRATIAIDQDKEGSVRRNILIGDETRGGCFATVGSSEAVFILSNDAVRRLTTFPLKN